MAITSDAIGTVDTNTLVPHEQSFIDQYVADDASGGRPGHTGGTGTGSDMPGPSPASSGCSAGGSGSGWFAWMLCLGALVRRRRVTGKTRRCAV